MNINFDHYLKFLNPIGVVIFSAYFISTLLFFVLPKRGIDFVNNVNNIRLNTLSNSKENSNHALSKNLVIKAIYKIANGKSWLVLNNKKTAKKIFIQEGQEIDGFLLHKINSNSAVFKNDKSEFKLKLFVNSIDIQHIIKKKWK